MNFIRDDGGRKTSGYKGVAGDCVTRAIAIAAEMPYKEVYDELFNRSIWIEGHSRVAATTRKNPSPRSGVFKEIYKPYLFDLGFVWTPTMQIGSSCKVHLRADELPSGRLVVRVSKHLTCVIDGVIHDTHDPSRNGTRCVYGYYRKE